MTSYQPNYSPNVNNNSSSVALATPGSSSQYAKTKPDDTNNVKPQADGNKSEKACTPITRSATSRITSARHTLLAPPPPRSATAMPKRPTSASKKSQGRTRASHQVSETVNKQINSRGGDVQNNDTQKDEPKNKHTSNDDVCEDSKSKSPSKFSRQVLPKWRMDPSLTDNHADMLLEAYSPKKLDKASKGPAEIKKTPANNGKKGKDKSVDSCAQKSGKCSKEEKHETDTKDLPTSKSSIEKPRRSSRSQVRSIESNEKNDAIDTREDMLEIHSNVQIKVERQTDEFEDFNSNLSTRTGDRLDMNIERKESESETTCFKEIPIDTIKYIHSPPESNICVKEETVDDFSDNMSDYQHVSVDKDNSNEGNADFEMNVFDDNYDDPVERDNDSFVRQESLDETNYFELIKEISLDDTDAGEGDDTFNEEDWAFTENEGLCSPEIPREELSGEVIDGLTINGVRQPIIIKEATESDIENSYGFIDSFYEEDMVKGDSFIPSEKQLESIKLDCVAMPSLGASGFISSGNWLHTEEVIEADENGNSKENLSYFDDSNLFVQGVTIPLNDLIQNENESKETDQYSPGFSLIFKQQMCETMKTCSEILTECNNPDSGEYTKVRDQSMMKMRACLQFYENQYTDQFDGMSRDLQMMLGENAFHICSSIKSVMKTMDFQRAHHEELQTVYEVHPNLKNMLRCFISHIKVVNFFLNIILNLQTKSISDETAYSTALDHTADSLSRSDIPEEDLKRAGLFTSTPIPPLVTSDNKRTEKDSPSLIISDIYSINERKPTSPQNKPPIKIVIGTTNKGQRQYVIKNPTRETQEDEPSNQSEVNKLNEFSNQPTVSLNMKNTATQFSSTGIATSSSRIDTSNDVYEFSDPPELEREGNYLI